MDKKAQVAVEFLTTYGWVLVGVIILLAVLLYYGAFDPMRFVSRQCNFEPGLPCTTYKLESNLTTGGAVYIVQLSNNLGYDISFPNNSIQLNAENVGKAGKQTYTGNCSPVFPAVIKKGQTFTCIVNIPYKEVVPPIGKTVRLDSHISYNNCLTAQNYTTTGDCTAASNYTTTGTAITQMEPYSGILYCGDGVCSPEINENSAICPADCPYPASIILTANPKTVAPDGVSSSAITATVRDSRGNPMQSMQVTFEAQPFGNLNALSGVTDASGKVTVTITSAQAGTVTVTAFASTLSNMTQVMFYIIPQFTCNPPATGTWLITTKVVCTDRSIYLNGNLTITGSGSLTFENVSMTLGYGNFIEVQSGGTFNVTDHSATQQSYRGDACSGGSYGNNGSVIVTNGGINYSIIADPGSQFNMQNSVLSSGGSNGVYSAGNVSFLNNWVPTSNTTITVSGSSGTIYNNCFSNDITGVLLAGSTNNVSIVSNTMWDAGWDIIGSVSNSNITGNDINTGDAMVYSGPGWCEHSGIQLSGDNNTISLNSLDSFCLSKASTLYLKVTGNNNTIAGDDFMSELSNDTIEVSGNNNTVTGTTAQYIFLDSGSGNIVTNNVMQTNFVYPGLALTGSIRVGASVSNCIISSNQIINGAVHGGFSYQTLPTSYAIELNGSNCLVYNNSMSAYNIFTTYGSPQECNSEVCPTNAWIGVFGTDNNITSNSVDAPYEGGGLCGPTTYGLYIANSASNTIVAANTISISAYCNVFGNPGVAVMCGSRIISPPQPTFSGPNIVTGYCTDLTGTYCRDHCRDT